MGALKWVVGQSKGKVFLVRLQIAIKRTVTFEFAINAKAGEPCAAPLVKVGPRQFSCLPTRFSVPRVLLRRHGTKVAKSVVRSVAVDVVNWLIWPKTVMYCPRSSVRLHGPVAQFPSEVSIPQTAKGWRVLIPCIPCGCAGFRAFSASPCSLRLKEKVWAFSPSQGSSFPVVIDKKSKQGWTNRRGEFYSHG